MIYRIWHGWTKPGADADQYEAMLRAEVLPGIHRIDGFTGAELLRCDQPAETEFVTICIFDDMAAVKRFAGENYAYAVLHPEARKLLTRWDEKSAHYMKCN